MLNNAAERKGPVWQQLQITSYKLKPFYNYHLRHVLNTNKYSYHTQMHSKKYRTQEFEQLKIKATKVQCPSGYASIYSILAPFFRNHLWQLNHIFEINIHPDQLQCVDWTEATAWKMTMNVRLLLKMVTSHELLFESQLLVPLCYLLGILR